MQCIKDNINIVPDHLLYRSDYLHELTISANIPEFLGHLYIAQEDNTILGRYWHLSCTIPTDYDKVHNSLDEVLNVKNNFTCLKY